MVTSIERACPLVAGDGQPSCTSPRVAEEPAT